MSREMTKEGIKKLIRQAVREELAEMQAESHEHGAHAAFDDPVEQMAESAMNVSDLRKQHREQLSARETLKRTTGIDAAEFSDEQALQAAVREQRQRGRA